MNKHIEEFRIHDINYERDPYKSVFYPWGLGSGNIKFDYGAKTQFVGYGLDEAEAKYLINYIQVRIGGDKEAQEA